MTDSSSGPKRVLRRNMSPEELADFNAKVKEHKKLHYEKNKDAILEKMKQRRESDPEYQQQTRERNKQRYAALDKKEHKAKRKAYYEKNKEAILKKVKAYKDADPEARLRRDKAWRDNNKERKSANDKAWRLNNPDRARANHKRWREDEANRERILAEKKQAYWDDKENNLKKSKAWRQANPEKCKEMKERYLATPNGKLSRKRAQARYAIKQQFGFSVVPDELVDLKIAATELDNLITSKVKSLNQK